MEKPYTILLIFLSLSLSASAQIRVGFYSKTCPLAETIVRNTVRSHFRKDFTIAPALLRMHFHDCFVRGCDASILLNGTSSEKTAPPNLGVRGYQVIDDAKTQLESACPRTVSCADILTLAARDSVLLTGGTGWSVPTGRKDGNVSLASEVNLPGPRDSIEVQKQKFADKGLTPQDMVALVGGHTIGTTACVFFSYRLYNFSGSGDTDPSMDPAFARQLKGLCPQNGDGTKRVALDNGSERVSDISFFRNIRSGRGVLESDQKLWSDASTQVFAKDLLGPKFFTEFARSMVKMSKVEVKTTESEGEIRRVCSAVNLPAQGRRSGRRG